MSANDGAASSSNVAAEGTYMDPQLYAAAVEGNIEPFKDNAIEFESIVTPNKDTILHINIRSRNRSTNFVEYILGRCPLLFRQPNVNDETPLHVAAKCGHSDIVKVLIKSSAKTQQIDLESGIRFIGMTNNEGDTALHIAVRFDHLDVVKILTGEDPDFSYSSNRRGETPLYIAAAAKKKNSLEIVVEILETCTSPAYEGPNQMTALHAVSMNFRPDIRRKILEKKKSLIKERDQNGWTPLHYAAYYQNSMEMLLACDISAAYIGDKHRKMTPLHIAIGRGYIPNEIISRCLDCCELVDERRWNVLHFAMLSLNMEDLTILLKYPLIRNLINDKDVDGNTPLHLLAIFRSHLLPKIKDLVGDIKLDFRFRRRVGRAVYFISQQQKQQILRLENPDGPYKYGVVRVKEVTGVNREEYKKEFQKQMEKVKESHLIVAALIATVTFTAAFTLPGGLIQDGNKDEGTAILSKKSAFQAFVITDAIAMVLSLSAVFSHFLMSILPKWASTEKSMFMIEYGAYSTIMALGAMVIAFVTGTYAVLTTSLWLAILTTFIGLYFFLLMCFIWMRADPSDLDSETD